MALSNAERQARYRERHKDDGADPGPKDPRDARIVALQQRVADLEQEVGHLKTELASRPPLHPFGSPRPAPKPSRSRTSGHGRAG